MQSVFNYIMQNETIRNDPKYIMYSSLYLKILSLFPKRFRGFDLISCFKEKVLKSNITSEADLNK